MNRNIKKLTLTVGDRAEERPKSEPIVLSKLRNHGDNKFGFVEARLDFKDYPELRNIVLFISVELEEQE